MENQFSTVGNFHIYFWSTFFCFQILYFRDHFLPKDDMSKYSVLIVKMMRWLRCYEKLGAICVFSAIGHGQKEVGVMLHHKVLIRKKSIINRFSTSSITFGKISGLNHEVFDHAVEGGSFVVQRKFRLLTDSFLSCAQGTKILTCFWTNI